MQRVFAAGNSKWILARGLARRQQGNKMCLPFYGFAKGLATFMSYFQMGPLRVAAPFKSVTTDAGVSPFAIRFTLIHINTEIATATAASPPAARKMCD